MKTSELHIDHFGKGITDVELERQRLEKVWHNYIDDYQGKKVRCLRSATISGNRNKAIEKDQIYTVESVKMFAGCVPCYQLNEIPDATWHPDKFELITKEL